MGEKKGIACVNVDLDAIPHYLGIHGMDAGGVSDQVRHGVCRTGLPRFLESFGRTGVKATFFAVGDDLSTDAESAGNVAAAHAQGHEIANHTKSHPYGLTRLDAKQLEEQVAGGEASIQAVTGTKPVGFRAPGYAVTAELLRILQQRGYAYDSSAFPAAPYYLAKACIMGALKLSGHPSAAILDRPRVLAAPLSPYRPARGEPYARGDGRDRLELLELPLSVTPTTRIPFIGTSALLFPGVAVKAVCRRFQGGDWLNFELHGIDMLDADDLKLPALAAVQREVGIPVGQKVRRLESVFRFIADNFQVVTLREAARILQGR